MKKFSSFKSILPVCLASLVLSSGFSSASYAAETSGSTTRYITDSIEVPMRSGPSYKHRIKRMITSGQSVQLLEVNPEGWARIEYKGSDGWMPAIMLENQPVARVRLAAQIEKTSAVETKYNELKQELDTLQTRFDGISSELKTVKQEKFELNQKFNHLKEVSSNAVQLDEQNQEMKARLSRLEDENAIMREQIDQSDDAIKRQWFLTGGGVLLLGLLLGRFFRVPKKRQKWGEF
ncbi:TIGR04211 family SH3 domain-containing protein [Thiomicrorhabdus sp. zzn3]|uniref:TIGR04211 family SH3 domain-containing protein n=1 Tax=Thiomicrorhabdus sp. zzn3 TaxID=3039775 RepID=UPI00243730FF|nr:TIGR04211 family SH3 domain-containing protein [Thiomicrorhabdus sp. zzn3]MDG6777451.1 TIGR04211 family SH3 domain-containing protein [Thiomicrorhabdus sp. zzn3]